MNTLAVNQLIVDLLIILVAGFLAGTLCRRLGVSLIVGYLVVGAVIGEGGLHLVGQTQHELEYLARAGALLLLFSVGIEFAVEELIRLSRFFFLGGATQMLLVSVPLFVACVLWGMPWNVAILTASAGALSSTVLVFKALVEWGQIGTPHGRRAIGILLFQDVALLPLMLLVPLLTGTGEPLTPFPFLLLAGKSILFVAAVMVARLLLNHWFVPMLTNLRSVELVALFSLSVLGGVCFGSQALGLPPAIGALAAGLMLSGTRLSRQIDTILLPFRESFSVVFFVTLGTLLHPLTFFDEPLLLTAGIVGMLLLKTFAASVALKLTGLNWKSSLGMGIGLAQLGEFSFLLIASALSEGIIRADDYNRMLFVALGTLILTPQLLKFGLRWCGPQPETNSVTDQVPVAGGLIQRALVIGVGPIGRQLASRLEIRGIEVCLVDLSPINLHSYSQQGFQTVSGDARDPDVLRRARVGERHLVIVAIPHDEIANQIVRSVRELNPATAILVRCRFLANVSAAKKAGANAVVSEEHQASEALLHLCERLIRPTD